jgi:hypothetical protein
VTDRPPPGAARFPPNAFDPSGWQDAFFGAALQAFDPRTLLGMSAGAVERPLEMMLGLPRFAFPMLDRKLMALGAGWLLLLQRGGEHGARVLRAWSEAYADLLAELGAAAAAGKPVHAGRELLDRWVAVLNRKLQTVQRADDFLASQRALLDALLSSRSRERELIELMAAAFDLPTRTEMDDAHRSVRDLKREVRALRRELEEHRANATDAPRTRRAAGRRAAAPPGTGRRAAEGGNGSSRPDRPG